MGGMGGAGKLDVLRSGQRPGEPGSSGSRSERVERAVQHQGRLRQAWQFGAQVGLMQDRQSGRQRFAAGLRRGQQRLPQMLQQGFLSCHAARLQAEKAQQRGLRIGQQRRAERLQVGDGHAAHPFFCRNEFRRRRQQHQARDLVRMIERRAHRHLPAERPAKQRGIVWQLLRQVVRPALQGVLRQRSAPAMPRQVERAHLEIGGQQVGQRIEHARVHAPAVQQCQNGFRRAHAAPRPVA